MTQYNTLRVKLSKLKLNKLKLGIKNCTEVTLDLSSNVTGNAKNETDFPHKSLLTKIQVLRLCKAFAKKFIS